MSVTRSIQTLVESGCSDGPRTRGRAVSRPQATVVQGTRPGRRTLPRVAFADQGREPPHGLPEAACPNIGECWQQGTATFMILGDTCTRRCGFCNIKTGKPTWDDPLFEPAGRAIDLADGTTARGDASVDRDDMYDYGAHAFVGVEQIRRQSPTTKIEVLTPDFRGRSPAIARPDVFNHNVEVVPRLYSVARRARAVDAGTEDRQRDGRRRGHDQIRPDGRTRRVVRGDAGRARHTAREPRPGAHGRPGICGADFETTCRSSATGTPNEFEQLERAYGPDSSTSRQAWSAQPPRRPARRQTEPGVGPLKAAV